MILNYITLYYFILFLEEQQQKIEELIRTVKLAEEKQAQLNKELVAKDEVIKDMKIQARANEKRYLDEMRKKNQQVISLRAELDHKSGNIAYLTTEMHKLKVLQLSSEDIVTKPSRESSGIKSRRHKAMTAADIRSRPVTAKGQGQLAPDAEVFLAHTYTNEDRQSSPVSVKPTPPVLPPIQGGEEVSRALARRQQILRRRNLQSTPPEVSVLAVDKMASSSNTQVYEPHTTTD